MQELSAEYNLYCYLIVIFTYPYLYYELAAFKKYSPMFNNRDFDRCVRHGIRKKKGRL